MFRARTARPIGRRVAERPKSTRVGYLLRNGRRPAHYRWRAGDLLTGRSAVARVARVLGMTAGRR